MRLLPSAILIAAFFAAFQIFARQPDGFTSGDQGSKFLQARAFADRGPLQPGIDVASRDLDPAYRFQEPKLKNRRGRLVSEFLWLLPLLTSPFLRLLGLRGLYVVPALSVIATFACAAAIARGRFAERGVPAGWLVVLTTPITIYGLELWEHAPAAACVLAAAWLLMPAREGGHDERSLRGRAAAAGALIMTGFLFREEVVVALAALPLARALAIGKDRAADLRSTIVWVAAGAAIVFAAAVPINLMIYGAPLPMHMTQDAWDVERTTPYLQVRRDFIVDLILPASDTGLFAAALAAGIAASAYALRGGRHREAARWIVHAAVAVALVICAGLPLWRLAHGVRGHDAYRLSSAAHTWTFALALLYWPWRAAAGPRRSARDTRVRFLLVAALLLTLLIDIVVPSAGGAQWSPRFLLPVAPLLGLAVVALVTSVRANARLRLDVACAVGVVLVASIAMQATGVLFVARATARDAAITRALAASTAPGDVVISNVFWFPEVTATLAPTRRMLFSWPWTDVPRMAALAIRAGMTRFNLVTLLPLTGYDAPPFLDVPGAPCRFARGERIPLDADGLTLSRYACAAP